MSTASVPFVILGGFGLWAFRLMILFPELVFGDRGSIMLFLALFPETLTPVLAASSLLPVSVGLRKIVQAYSLMPALDGVPL